MNEPTSKTWRDGLYYGDELTTHSVGRIPSPSLYNTLVPAVTVLYPSLPLRPPWSEGRPKRRENTDWQLHVFMVEMCRSKMAGCRLRQKHIPLSYPFSNPTQMFAIT